MQSLGLVSVRLSGIPSRGCTLQTPFRYAWVPSDAKNFDISLSLSTEGWKVEYQDPLTSRYPPSKVLSGLRIDDPSPILEAVDRWNHYLYLFPDTIPGGPETPTQLSVKAELYALQVTGDPMKKSGSVWSMNLMPHPDTDLFRVSSNKLDPGPTRYLIPGDGKVKVAKIANTKCFYGLKLTNDSEHDLYPYVFYFEPSTHSIQV